MELSQAARARYLEEDKDGCSLFDRSRCTFCGGVHDADPCPRVRLLEYQTSNGSRVLVGIEFWQWDEWPHEDVVWRTDLYDDDAE
jgi:hypothetical protein